MSSTNYPIGSGKERQDRPARPPHVPGEDRATLIAELALCKWERAGSPRGRWEAFWLEAEQELLAGSFSTYFPGK